MPNLLAHESSPYLLQHKDNPVAWHPWGPEALARAKAEDKPIFLSIGYSACHWCHVMEHESFEDEEVAALMNESFINVKVDREERPELDQIYMNAVQLMTGHGGWPMSVFLTPDLEPFYGGTYWPPYPRMGMPGFTQVLEAIREVWRNRREQALRQAAELTEHLRALGSGTQRGAGLDERLLHAAAAKLERDFDHVHGGFGLKPKFPHAMALRFLLRIWHRTGRPAWLEMVKLNLDKMARGGIYDHLAGGFARYSVDERWLVPHFEKMLYDNALLAEAYLDGFLATGHPEYARVARETLDYVLRYMTDERGGFYSAEDADSEGEEGKFYLWPSEEVIRILGPEQGERFCYVYDVSPEGNFEGQSILNLPKTPAQCARLKGWDVAALEAELAEARRQLLAARDRRVRPGKDDKVLLNWNALMIEALARAGAVLQEPRYLQAAVQAAEFTLAEMTREDGRLLHCWRRGQAKLDAYLDDYAFFTQALITLYECQFDERWIDAAVRLADLTLKHFGDLEAAGLFYTADDHERLIARTKDVYESSIPSGNAMAATALLRLGKLCGRSDYLEAAHEIVEMAGNALNRAPSGMGQMLIAADVLTGPMHEIVVIGEEGAAETQAALADLHRRYLPHCVVAFRPPIRSGRSPHLDPLFEGKTARGPGPTVYICQNFTCQAPVSGGEAIRDALDALTTASGQANSR